MEKYLKIRNSSCYNALMRGESIPFTQEELFEILKRQSELYINTLKIQKTIDGIYYCRVDELTTRAFYKMNDDSLI